MSWRKRFASLFRPNRLDRELSEELRFHLEQQTAKNIQKGMTPEEARLAALRAFGGVEQIKERCRDMRGTRLVNELIQDLRYGLRMFAKSPGFTAVAVLTLALGIGANTAIFSALNALMLKTLPVRNPEQLVVLKWFAPTVEHKPYQAYSGWTGCPHTEGRLNGCSFSYPAFEQFRNLSQDFSSAFAFAGPIELNLAANGQAGLAWCELVSGEFFPTLGVEPILGRALSPQDDTANGAPVVVISYGYWERRFGKDPTTIGKAITINTHPFTIVGVAPPEFFGLERGWPRDVWIPLARQRELHLAYDKFTDPETWWVDTVARIKPGATREQAQAAASLALQQSLTARAKGDSKNLPWIELAAVNHGLYALRRNYSKPLFMLMGLVALVLLIACANVANLLLARSAARRREVAMRLALGAARGRLVRQFLTESALLAGLGGGAGLLLAYWGANLMRGFIGFGAEESLALDVRPDLTVLAFAAALSMLTAIVFGLAPAFRGTRLDVTPALKGEIPAGRKRRFGFGLAQALVALQASLSLFLLIGAGLFVRTLINLETENVGFNQRRLLLFSLSPEFSGYSKERDLALNQELQEHIRSLPGVLSVSYSDRALLSQHYMTEDFTFAGRQFEEVRVLSVGPDFFETMQIPMVSGRSLGLQDTATAAQVAVVNEALARRLPGHPDPVGLRVKMEDKWEREIVGVAASAKYDQIREDPPPTIYIPFPQAPWYSAAKFEVRTSGDPRSLIPAIRRLVSDLAKDVPLSDVKTQEEQIAQTLLVERMFARLSGFFGLLALALASVGLYGLMSHAVARRTGEIGVRMALGAERGDVAWMVLRESLGLVLLGIALGLPVSWGASKFISSMLYALRPHDPATLIGATIILLGVAAVAAYLPARRASRVEPMTALRHE